MTLSELKAGNRPEVIDLSKQKGASLYALIVVMTLLGILILAGLKLSPAYIEDMVVKNTIENLKESGELEDMSLRDIRRYVTRTVQTNGGNFASDSIDQVEEGGVDYIAVEYESRVVKREPTNLKRPRINQNKANQ
jgi:hypothetical protein